MYNYCQMYSKSFLRVQNFSASEWRRVKIFTNSVTISTFMNAFRKFYSVDYSEADIKKLLRRFQTECRLAYSFPEVKSMMYLWLGFEIKLSSANSKKAIHAKNFYNFIPLMLECFD